MKWGNADGLSGCRGILNGVGLMLIAILLVLMAGCVAPAGGASLAYPEPYPSPPQETTPLSLRRTGPTTAELCAPAGIVWARSGSQYRVAYDAWPGGCQEIGSHATYVGGDIYCTIDLVCTPPLEGWRREYVLWLPFALLCCTCISSKIN